MKKKLNGRFLHWGNRTSKLSKIMRISFVLLVAVFMQVSAASYSQSQKVSLKAGKVSLPELFKMIQEQSDFDFFYQPEAVSETKNVSLKGERVEIEEVLNEALRGTGLEYKIIDTDIVILPKKEVAKTESRVLTAQQTTGKITGTIVDMTGESIPGVSVMIKGTTTGTITNIEGVYELNNIAEDAVIVYSFIGFTTQEVNVAGRSTINITLYEEMTGLDEVVVVGYGSMQRKQITSAVATIGGDELTHGTTSNPLEQIQGKVAGVSITRPGGSDPNKSPEILIRGMGSVGNADPLIIVDGVEVGSLDVVAPEDIETFSILKDGSAAAIYGSRGTNGVVLITTKGGKAGETKVEYSGLFSFETVSERPNVLNGDEFRAMAKRVEEMRGLTEPIPVGDASTDWYEELLQPSHNQVHNVAISGGSDKSNYRASIDYMDNQGIALESYKKRVNGRININHKAINDRLNVKVSLSASQSKYRAADYGAFGTATTLDPTQPVYQDNGDYTTFDRYGIDNPVASIDLKTKDNKQKVLLSNIYADFRIIDGLKVGGRMAWKIEDLNRGEYESKYTENSVDNKEDGVAHRRAWFTYRNTYEINANYRKQFGLHELSGMFNWTSDEDIYENMEMKNYGFVSDAFLYNKIEAGSFLTDPESPKPAEMKTYKSKRAIESWRGRLVYSYDDKYMFTASFNREGSTIFGENYKWGSFYGVSGGWTISNESFMDGIGAINYLKLRIGYGETGNDAANPYASFARIGQEGLSYQFRGQSLVSFGLLNNPNPNLRWEKKAETNFGLDYTVLNNRFDGSIDYYRRKTTDLLKSVPAPLPSQLNPTVQSNVGEIFNSGIEFTLNSKIIKKSDFSWNASFNFSYNKNKIEKTSIGENGEPWYYKGLPAPGGLGTVYVFEQGGSVGDFYGKRFSRIDEDGMWLFLDKEGKEVNTADVKEEDKAVIGNGIPKYNAGLTNRITYKNFDFEFFFRGVFDFDILNVGKMYYENIQKFPGSNVYSTTLNNGLMDNSQYSDYYLEDGSYVKLDNITLGYTINVSKVDFLSYARLFVSCNNVYTFTNYSGLSPEIGKYTGDPNDTGMEAGYDGLDFYPITRTFSVGAVIKF